jgi:hypothetical protein
MRGIVLIIGGEIAATVPGNVSNRYFAITEKRQRLDVGG